MKPKTERTVRRMNGWGRWMAVGAWLAGGLAMVSTAQAAGKIPPEVRAKLVEVFVGPPIRTAYVGYPLDMPTTIYGRLKDGTTIVILTSENVDKAMEKEFLEYTKSYGEEGIRFSILGFGAVSLSPDRKKLLFSAPFEVREWHGVYELDTGAIRFVSAVAPYAFLWDPSSKKYASVFKDVEESIVVLVYDLSSPRVRAILPYMKTDAKYFWQLIPGLNSDINLHQADTKTTLQWLVPGKKMVLEGKQTTSVSPDSELGKWRTKRGISLTEPRKQRWIFNIETGEMETEPSVEVK